MKVTCIAAVQAAIAAAEARHAALSAEGRGQPLQRGMSRTLSSQAGSMGGSFGRDEGGRIAQLPGMRADPFRGAIPASAFRMEEHSPTGGLLLECIHALPSMYACLLKC